MIMSNLILLFTNHFIIDIIFTMLRLAINTIKRSFCAPKPKNNHLFTDFQLRQLLNQPNELRDIMVEQINQIGELKVSDYWKQAMTDQKYGYYRDKNVFSKEGDFITSPQISPIFGEMVATWLTVFMQTPTINIVNPLSNAVQKKFRIIELGGGRGMLMQDILRTFHSFKIDNNYQLCFIQIAQFNRKQQQKSVMDQFKKNKTFFKFDFQNATQSKEQFLPQNEFKDIKLKWFSKLQDLVKEDYESKKKGKQIPFTIFVMNEFFDALPITILQYTELGWRQKVLRLSRNPQFKFQLSNSSNSPHQKLLPSLQNPKVGDRIQISPESLMTMDMMAKMIKYSGGGILNIDYGGNGPFVDSIRAIKGHKYIPSPFYWEFPGICDLSAHVAFSSLAQYAEKTEGVKAFELIPQQFFLEAMGIETRVENLCKTAKKQKAQRLQSELKRLTDPEQMGEYYKVQIITLKQYGEIYPHITINSNVF